MRRLKAYTAEYGIPMPSAAKALGIRSSLDVQVFVSAPSKRLTMEHMYQAGVPARSSELWHPATCQRTRGLCDAGLLNTDGEIYAVVRGSLRSPLAQWHGDSRSWTAVGRIESNGINFNVVLEDTRRLRRTFTVEFSEGTLESEVQRLFEHGHCLIAFGADGSVSGRIIPESSPL